MSWGSRLRRWWQKTFPPYPDFPPDMGEYSRVPSRPYPPAPPPRRQPIEDTKGSYVPPTNALPPPPSEEPSCFAKGIAASIVKEPEVWEEMSRNDGLVLGRGESEVCYVHHLSTGVHLFVIGEFETASNKKYYAGISGGPYTHSIPSDADKDLIVSTILSHPIGQLARKQAERATQEEKERKAVSYFTTLGCPPSSSS